MSRGSTSTGRTRNRPALAMETLEDPAVARAHLGLGNLEAEWLVCRHPAFPLQDLPPSRGEPI
jgi:hypothetical protein